MIPFIHFVLAGEGEESPCGDDDLDAPVTHDPNEVTCDECLKVLGWGQV